MTAAISHQSGAPSFLAPPPRFSFFEPAHIEALAPVTYQRAQIVRVTLQAHLGPEFHDEVARRAALMWQLHRPWWLAL